MNGAWLTSALVVTMLLAAPIARAEVDELSRKQSLVKQLMLITEQRQLTETAIKANYQHLQEVTLPQTMEAELRKTLGSERYAALDPQRRDAAIKSFSARVVQKIRASIAEKLDVVSLSEKLTMDLYGKYLSEQELQELIDFYKTPIGKKTITIMPQLEREALKASAETFSKMYIEAYVAVAAEELPTLYADLFPSQCSEEGEGEGGRAVRSP